MDHKTYPQAPLHQTPQRSARANPQHPSKDYSKTPIIQRSHQTPSKNRELSKNRDLSPQPNYHLNKSYSTRKTHKKKSTPSPSIFNPENFLWMNLLNSNDQAYNKQYSERQRKITQVMSNQYEIFNDTGLFDQKVNLASHSSGRIGSGLSR
jgi:hypothetical protein